MASGCSVGKSHSGPSTETKHFVYDACQAMQSRIKNVAADSSGELWHKRLGHMSDKGMYILANQKLLQEVKGVHLERCLDCLVRK
mgnify:CR=1 FL=1